MILEVVRIYWYYYYQVLYRRFIPPDGIVDGWYVLQVHYKLYSATGKEVPFCSMHSILIYMMMIICFVFTTSNTIVLKRSTCTAYFNHNRRLKLELTSYTYLCRHK